MNDLILRYKTWFETRNLRERLLVCGLSWALIYAMFSVFAFNSLDKEAAELKTKMKKTNDEIVSSQTQLKYLHEIPSSPVYKDWVKSQANFQSLKDKYKNLLGKSVSEKWDEIIKAVLNNYPNILIEHIQNSPETQFQGLTIDTGSVSVYQQKAQVTALGNFQDIYSYLVYLEKAMPNIHWDRFSYKVTEYPQARIEMEFSVLYEKPKTTNKQS
jgi:hypothetical protein